MPPRRRTSKDSPAKLASRMKRRWRVVLLRHKGETSRACRGPRRGSGRKAAAAVQFDLDAFQSRRLLVQELGSLAERRPPPQWV